MQKNLKEAHKHTTTFIIKYNAKLYNNINGPQKNFVVKLTYILDIWHDIILIVNIQQSTIIIMRKNYKNPNLGYAILFLLHHIHFGNPNIQ
jgi:hypothetical protein